MEENTRGKDNKDKRLVYITFLQREDSVYHHTYDEELLQYDYIKTEICEVLKKVSGFSEQISQGSSPTMI